MKLKIGEKEVDLFVNGEKQIVTIKKEKLSNKQLSYDEEIKKAKERLKKEKENETL